MNLPTYLKNGWIRPHATSPQEIAKLLAIADRDIRQSQATNVEPEWRFDIAYNAALQLAVAVLAAAGYEADRQNKHQRTIECLAFVLPAAARDGDFLNACRKKRNTSVYEEIGMISQAEAEELTAFAELLRKKVKEWLKTNHAKLMK